MDCLRIRRHGLTLRLQSAMLSVHLLRLARHANMHVPAIPAAYRYRLVTLTQFIGLKVQGRLKHTPAQGIWRYPAFVYSCTAVACPPPSFCVCVCQSAIHTRNVIAYICARPTPSQANRKRRHAVMISTVSCKTSYSYTHRLYSHRAPHYLQLYTRSPQGAHAVLKPARRASQPMT